MASFHYGDVLIHPVVTEKSNEMMIEQNKYVFRVTGNATKLDVARAVADRFGVKVQNVNLVTLPRKPKRAGMHRFKTQVRRKAIVSLAEGERIPELSEAV